MKKNYKFLVFAFFLMCWGFAGAQTISEPAVFSVKVHFHCANGKALLENRLNALNAVESAVADLETKVVTITYDPAVLTQEKLIELIEQIGYYTEFSDQSKKIKKACSHDDHDHDHDHDHE
jgi:copper chaperone CopZ